MDSILTSIKKLLGIEEDYEHFDDDIIMHINSAFFILTQLGVGPIDGFSISDSSSTWSDFVSDINKLESVKTYIYLNVRMLFDPPQSSTHIDAIKRTIEQLEWRLNVATDDRGEKNQNG